jgi:hypothetical protein
MTMYLYAKKKTDTQTFTVALLTLVRKCKQPKCSTSNEEVHRGTPENEYYPHSKKEQTANT